MRNRGKILRLEDFDKAKLSVKDKKTVLVGGCFDLLHFGHFRFLKKAKKAGNYLIIALESDDFIKQRKKKTPVHSQRERAEILSSLRFVDLVILLPYLKTDKEYFNMVKKINPSIVAATSGDPEEKNKKSQIENIRGKFMIVSEKIKGFSTQSIINKFL